MSFPLLPCLGLEKRKELEEGLRSEGFLIDALGAVLGSGLWSAVQQCWFRVAVHGIRSLETTNRTTSG